MRLSPVLEAMQSYPFVRLAETKAKLVAAGVELVDLGAGEPREETPRFIREALAAAIEPISTYPAAQGLPELREAVSAWVGARFGAGIDPETQVVPTLGSKEAIFHLAQVVGPGAVALTTPGYPVPERGARFAIRNSRGTADNEQQRQLLPTAGRVRTPECFVRQLYGSRVRRGVPAKDEDSPDAPERTGNR